MKVDVITLHAVKNYGSVLQALATQELLKAHGCDVTIINFVKEESKTENLMKFWAGKNPIKAVAVYPTIKRWQRVFDKFCEERLNLSDEIYTTEEDFKDYSLTADMYCTGSDQVWNSKWNNGILAPLYLSFVPKNKFKFAFSASFGQTKLSNDEIEATRMYIEQYKYISVREASGKEIIEQQYGYPEAMHILDPTLCVEPELWREKATPRKIKEDYILIYNLNRSKEFDNYAKELSRRTGLKLVRLCTRYDQIYRVGKSVLVPEVFEFISLIDNARYVLTDSFHATAFSMNMNTEPICVYPAEFSGRLDSFLKLTESSHRHVKDYGDFDVVNRPVDFNNVNRILETNRRDADEFLSKVIESAKKFVEEGE